MSLSDSSSALSSPPSSDNEEEPPKPATPQKTLKLKGGRLTAASENVSPQSSPEPPAREPSPPHEYVLADNPDIAFLVMFRARFADTFPKNVPNLGPQDIERGVVETQPSEQIENFLCALLGLVLNRKKSIERGHYGRALEEAISTHRSQWPISWQGVNPLPGIKTFADLNPTERLELLKTLVLWALNSSEIIIGLIKESYKQNRQNDDLNQPLSIQSWGSDGRKRRYWLIEGQHDTPFRLYRESPPRIVNKTWWSVAGTLEELKTVGESLKADGSQAGRRLAERITAALPRLEETQEKRKRKEYRQARRSAFLRPEPGFSAYEGRTRGKRIKYTFSDDEDFSESHSVRRSARNGNGSTPGEFNGPTITASGRHVRSRFGRSYGEPLDQSREGTATIESSETGDADISGYSVRADGRPQRTSARAHHRRARDGYSPDDELGEDDDHDSNPSGEEWQGDDNDVEGILDREEDDDFSDNESDDSLLHDTPSLVITLRYKPPVRTSVSEVTMSENGYPASDPLVAVNGSPLLAVQSPPVAHRPKFIVDPDEKAPTQTQFAQPLSSVPFQQHVNSSNLNGSSTVAQYPQKGHSNLPYSSNQVTKPTQSHARAPASPKNNMSISSITHPDPHDSVNDQFQKLTRYSEERPPELRSEHTSNGQLEQHSHAEFQTQTVPKFPHSTLSNSTSPDSFKLYDPQYPQNQSSQTLTNHPSFPQNQYPAEQVKWNGVQ